LLKGNKTADRKSTIKNSFGDEIQEIVKSCGKRESQRYQDFLSDTTNRASGSLANHSKERLSNKFHKLGCKIKPSKMHAETSTKEDSHPTEHF
jgi:hypothetical protein